MKRTRVLTIAVATVCALTGTAALVVFWEKDMPHPSAESWITAHYRGLGREADSTGLMGYMWSGVTQLSEDGGYWRMNFEAPGYNEFVGYYPDGSIREIGTCMVHMTDILPEVPTPDFHDVDSSRCYKPDGTLGSEVVNGTGIQTIWRPDGTKIWELHLEDHVRTLHRMWYDNGQLRGEQAYEDGFVHGPFTSYYEDGQVQMTGEYDLGERVGVWKTYEQDGTLWSEEDYTNPDGE